LINNWIFSFAVLIPFYAIFSPEIDKEFLYETVYTSINNLVFNEFAGTGGTSHQASHY
jgi:hypothetical protein